MLNCLVDAVLVGCASASRAEEHDAGIICIGSTEPDFKASACAANVAGAPHCLRPQCSYNAIPLSNCFCYHAHETKKGASLLLIPAAERGGYNNHDACLSAHAGLVDEQSMYGQDLCLACVMPSHLVRWRTSPMLSASATLCCAAATRPNLSCLQAKV